MVSRRGVVPPTPCPRVQVRGLTRNFPHIQFDLFEFGSEFFGPILETGSSVGGRAVEALGEPVRSVVEKRW